MDCLMLSERNKPQFGKVFDTVKPDLRLGLWTTTDRHLHQVDQGRCEVKSTREYRDMCLAVGLAQSHNFGYYTTYSLLWSKLRMDGLG